MDDSQILKEFGNHIKAIRTEKNISIYKLAINCSVEEKFLIKLENGEIDCLLDFLSVLAKALDVKVSSLMDY